MAILDLISQGLGLAGDAFNIGSQISNTQYLKGVQEKTWEREDNAVQRRAADMAKAGINPLLAAGAAASSSAPIQVGVPQADLRNAEGMATMLRQGKENALTASQKALNDQKYWKEAEMYNAGIAEAKAKAESAKVDAQEKAWNLKQWMDRGLPTNQGGFLGQAAGWADWLPKAAGTVLGPPVIKGAFDSLKEKAEKAVSNLKEGSRLKKREAYEEGVRSGKVSLQGGM